MREGVTELPDIAVRPATPHCPGCMSMIRNSLVYTGIVIAKIAFAVFDADKEPKLINFGLDWINTYSASPEI